MKKLMTIVIMTMALVSCGDEAQFEGMDRIETLTVEEAEPETQFLCQYDEDGELIKKVEFEVKDVELFKERYSFVECREPSKWAIEIEPIILPEVDVDLDW
jgi:hypothetical protein